MKKMIAFLTAVLVFAAIFSGCTAVPSEKKGQDNIEKTQIQESAPVVVLEDMEQELPEDHYAFPTQSLADPSDIRYTDVPGMPTQDYVLLFEDVRNEETYDVAVQEPDQLTKNALFDIYDFVQSEQRKPVRYFEEDVQKAVQELLPTGVSADILHMTEFMQIIPDETKKRNEEDENYDAEVKVIIDADYRPGQLVLVMVGDRQECKEDDDIDLIEWTPFKASVTDVGKIEFVIPAELVEKIEGKDILFNVLTDRVGTRGSVIRYENGEIIITYPSKTASDTITIQRPIDENGTQLPDEFEVRHVEDTEAIRKEIEKMRLQREAKKSFISFYPLTAQHEAQLLLPDGFDMDSLVAYEMLNVDCVNYSHTYGDVLLRISFATPFKDGQDITVMLGLERENRVNPDDHELDWVALRAEVKEDYVDITFPQVGLEVMEEHPALLVVLSEPLKSEN